MKNIKQIPQGINKGILNLILVDTNTWMLCKLKELLKVPTLGPKN